MSHLLRGGQDTCPGLPEGLGEVARSGGTKALFSSSLFPTMPRHNYRRVAPSSRPCAAKHGLSYEV